jgi:hypothetical protein
MLLATLAFASSLPAQPRVRLPGTGAADGGGDTLKRPIFDSYGNSGAGGVPDPPAFGSEGGASGSSEAGRSWFGFPIGDSEDAESRRPLFTQGLFGGEDNNSLFSGDAWSSVNKIRFQYTWLVGGKNPRSLDISDFDLALPIQIPDFFGSGQPWYLVPTFGLHLWDGPAVLADLPAQAYSAVLQSYFRSDPEQRIGVELGAGVGIYSDFNTLTFHSLRVTGRGLLHLRLTPDAVFKGGAIYLGRNNVRLLPAVGLVWTPDAQTRWDISFPEPRFSRYYTTVNDLDVWWYLGAEYGGGAWTIRRDAGFSDQIDINDVRLSIGWEWGSPKAMETGLRSGFVETGLVFDREIRYAATPAADFSPRSTVFLRVGLGY